MSCELAQHTFSEYLDVDLLAEVVWVDKRHVVRVLGLESNVALAARVQQHRKDCEALARWRVAVDCVPDLRARARQLDRRKSQIHKLHREFWRLL